MIRLQEAVLQRIKSLEAFYYRRQVEALNRKLDDLTSLEKWQSHRKNALHDFPHPQQIKSILIFKPDEIGDAIYSLPAIKKLGEQFKNARFYLLCQQSTRPIFERTLLFDEIVSVKVKKIWLRFPCFSLDEALSKFSIKEFDVSIFLRTYPAFFRFFLRVPAHYHLHPLNPRMKSRSKLKAPVFLSQQQKKPQSLQLLDIASLLTGTHYSEKDVIYPEFHWTEEDKKGTEQFMHDSYLVAHPFARYETRRYPIEYWIKILEEIYQTYQLPIYIIGGKEDIGFPEVKGCIPLQGKLTLSQSGYLISKAKAYLGNESGPLHWASVMGVPTIAFFGGHSLRPEWEPQGNVLLLHESTDCSPCHRRVCPGHGVKCLSTLTPESVLPLIREFLS